jgi:hypothetical protein
MELKLELLENSEKDSIEEMFENHIGLNDFVRQSIAKLESRNTMLGGMIE